jgi:elongation factor Ts
MAISANDVKQLREETGAGMLDCKKALEDAKGDFQKAKDVLKKKGFEAAAKREERETVEGLIVSYIHHNNRFGVLLELNCETDFVARTDDFRALADNIAKHIVGAAPKYLSEEDIPKDEKADPKEVALLSQPYIQDESVTINDMITEARSKTGENIRIKRFARFELGAS